MNQPTENRETWLRRLAELMAPRFEELGRPLPPFRVSVGFTSGGRSSRHQGEAWNKHASADGHYEIFIMPDMVEPDLVAAILCHELIHTAVGFSHGHKGDFAVMMSKMGLERPYTSSIPGDEFKAYIAPFLAQIGPMPHAELQCRSFGRDPKPDGEGWALSDDNDGDGPSSNTKKKQSTRMLKATCDDCGYTIRLSKKWAIEVGAECPRHGTMEIEGIANFDDA